MATKLDLENASASNMESNVQNLSPDQKTTDGATGDKETVWINSDWAKQWGYFNSSPELKSALLMKATWDVGKGYECDSRTEAILDHISGWGKDTFTDILFNMDLISRLSGDAFAEIIRDEKTGILINLKVLDPSTIEIVVDAKGIIKRYTQKTKGPNGKEIYFEPNEIFHLSHNRLADQIHGISDLQTLYSTLDAEYENFTDMKKIMHRQAKPMIMFKVGTDNAGKIANFVSKMDSATNKGENIYIPDDENTVSYDVVQVNVSQVLMEWRSDIKNKFYRTLGLPQIVFGSGNATESGGKIEYLAHEQVFEHDQKFLEGQIWNQLLLKIELVSPVSLLQNLQTDTAKDGQAQNMAMQQNDVTAGSGE